MKKIYVKGAKTHNLKNIDVAFPRNKLIIITGLSGSGKSSLAFDTIFAEGQRRYIESLSAYARQFLSRMEKPDIDYIEGLSPAISIEQKSASHNPRSTVGTITEIHDYLRLLFARVGTPQCPQHRKNLEAKTISQMVDEIMQLPADSRIMLLAPIVQNRKGEYIKLLDDLKSQGFLRVRINGELAELEEAPKLDLRKKSTIEVVVDRVKIKPGIELRLAESIDVALKLTQGLISVAFLDKSEEITFSSRFACPQCGYSLSELEPRLFSFNNPIGACGSCDGLGYMQYFNKDKLITNPTLSIAAGAIRGWGRNSRFNFRRLKPIAAYHKIDLSMPFSALSQREKDFIFHGNKSSSKIVARSKHARFTGILSLMERRYQETDSQLVREELAKYTARQACIECGGSRLNEKSRHVFITEKTLPQITALPISHTLRFFEQLRLPGQKAQIAEKIIAEIKQRLSFLVNVGLDYLSMDRSAETLSGGEAQRIRLASQIGSGLVGVMYILDEPSIGLHQRDNKRLLQTLTHLRDLGNTVIVVEHDEEAILAADHIIDIGPGAGKHGGEIVAQGTPSQIKKAPNSLTGKYLSGKLSIPVPEKQVINKKQMIRCSGLSGNNLKNITVEIPVGAFTCVTGVSGSGKSTFVNETLYKHVANKLHRSNLSAAPCKNIAGLSYIDKIIDIDQSPIGRTPRSNPATYTGLFAPIRELFSQVPEARARGYTMGRFSFNVRGGRCEACQGDGMIKVEMHFLPDIHVMCDICQGKRYSRETLDIRYKGVNIHEVLEMTVEQALGFFDSVPVIRSKLQTLMDVGLSYISLGQNATTLSGGEAQRIKLSRELSKRASGKTLYILDEPTTGLHFHDIKQLLAVLHCLRDAGNTIIVIEHNLDVIKTADWIIDLGPEGGDKGGKVVAKGTPSEVAKIKQSYTGQYLAKLLLKST